MITLQQILNAQAPLPVGARIKLARHKDHRLEYRDIIKHKDGLLDYQSTQPKDVFGGCDYVISFMGLEHRRSVLFGVFKVAGCKKAGGRYIYDMQRMPEYEALVDRLVIDWGDNSRAWHQWFDRQPKEVIEVLPKGYVGSFPGLLDFVLDFEQLKTLTRHPDANREWRHHLSAVNGIYLILDSKTGMQYIGSACGQAGIWQRWCNYAANGVGGNKELVALRAKDPTYHRYFRFSVLQSLPSNVTPREIVAIENRYKEKLGSRAHGLNSN